ncbi:TPA: alpha/beta hydrolase [Vibrio parahaemolyticus]|uniref:alpha/beta hydrolase family protein n=1 Tax=Vibrio parahaemolyticus TaxID=670 RepID=UPI0002F1BA49|nr:alpha/beta hydrolase [Vibrio parahaemolyticus]EJA7338845.1 alpha/beta hydrolase [Vibrio parahaemolyticus]MDF4682309.1 alpha/beta hydrolase [Vibrio parahaemolyticus]MDF4927177.1 alpha/beta hydrolase [Vibrio parahaemolyticus]MEA5330547.1 alpha/beta hydrolase [Vibrio parahaemolyticus]MEA5343789.1 alpha/beta hydrolase [Vibrio parahaemolyticus]
MTDLTQDNVSRRDILKLGTAFSALTILPAVAYSSDAIGVSKSGHLGSQSTAPNGFETAKTTKSHGSRMPTESLNKALAQLQSISSEDLAKVKALTGMVKPLRSFIHKTPDFYGMANWHELSIPSDDGTPLEAWYIPAKDGNSNKLVIFNHASPMCRSGFPGHFGAPWSNVDDGEVDFVIQYKHLTDAGYNVLTYDLRNHGTSSSANNGISGLGQWEWRDCVGVKKYVDSHPLLGKMRIALFSQCLGGISQYEAIARHPERFENVNCLCSPMVPTPSGLIDKAVQKMGIPQYRELVDLELLKIGAFTTEECNPRIPAPHVKMPVLMWQVREDSRAPNPTDAQQTFDLIGSDDKELIWIEGTNERFKDGYNWFGRQPQTVIRFLDKHM